MASSLFGGQSPQPQLQPQQNLRNELPQAVSAIMGMIRGQNPQILLKNLCLKDPQINAFVKSCEGKSPEQIAAQCGVDYGFLRSLIK